MEEELKSISFELGEEKEEMEKQLYKASTATESLNVAEAKVAELEKVVEDLKFEVEGDEKQRDMVDTACGKEGKAGLGMAVFGVSSGISITGGGRRVQRWMIGVQSRLESRVDWSPE